jgi:hypothetical protein
MGKPRTPEEFEAILDWFSYSVFTVMVVSLNRGDEMRQV